MFSKNDIIKLVDTNGIGAEAGALAIVVGKQEDGLVEINWLEITSNLNKNQHNGGYNSDRFELVTKGTRNIDVVLSDIEFEVKNLTHWDLEERFMNILGEFEKERLENILEDLRNKKIYY